MQAYGLAAQWSSIAPLLRTGTPLMAAEVDTDSCPHGPPPTGWDHQQGTWIDADWRARGKRSSPRGDTHYADKRHRGWDSAPK
eukprot:3271951-Pyramimonas_sp.AAC.1